MDVNVWACAPGALAREPGPRTVHDLLLGGPEAVSQGCAGVGQAGGVIQFRHKLPYCACDWVWHAGTLPATDGAWWGRFGVQQQNFPVSHYKLDPTKSRSQKVDIFQLRITVVKFRLATSPPSVRRPATHPATVTSTPPSPIQTKDCRGDRHKPTTPPSSLNQSHRCANPTATTPLHLPKCLASRIPGKRRRRRTTTWPARPSNS